MFGDANYEDGQAGYTMGGIGAAGDETPAPSDGSWADWIPGVIPGAGVLPIPLINPFGGSNPSPSSGPTNPFSGLFGGGDPPPISPNQRQVSDPATVRGDASMLRALGYAGAPDNGDSLDIDFRRAVYGFQKAVSPRAGAADGLIGPTTRTVLRTEYAKKTGGEPPPAAPSPGLAVIPKPSVPSVVASGSNRLLLVGGGLLAAALAAAVLFGGKKRKGKKSK